MEQAKQYNGFDFSLVEAIAEGGAKATLEVLGLDSAMRVSTVKGIFLFTDFYALGELMTGAYDKKVTADEV